MVDNTWETRYTKAIDNKYRNFNLWNTDDTTYEICNIFCNFEITKLDEKNYIKGITATSSSNLLHLNPLVDTQPPQKGLQAVGVHTGETTNRTEKVYIKYGFNKGVMTKYSLIDIFIQSPSKAVLAGKRYQMEVCLLFSSEAKDRFLVICVPMDVSPINTTDDILQKNRYTILMAIANNFPSKGKTYSIENAPNWDPRVFLPIKNENNSSFFTWNDPTTNNTVLYIQFEHPISVPYKFFESFANTLSGGVNIAKQATTLAAQKEYAGLDIYYNENIPNTNITTVRTCTEKTNPETQALVNYIKTEDKKDKPITPKPAEKCDIKCKANKWLIAIVIILSLALIGFLIWYFWKKRKFSHNNPSSSVNSSNTLLQPVPQIIPKTN